MCSNITYGAYFAQKHALLVVETFFAFPETNGTMEYFLLRSSKYKSFMLTMIILYSTIDLHFSILWIFLLRINPQAEMHWASLRDQQWVLSQAWTAVLPAGIWLCSNVKRQCTERKSVHVCADLGRRHGACKDSPGIHYQPDPQRERV